MKRLVIRMRTNITLKMRASVPKGMTRLTALGTP